MHERKKIKHKRMHVDNKNDNKNDRQKTVKNLKHKKNIKCTS
jgi:hypothetical protein